MENSRPYMRSLVKACENLGIKYKKLDPLGNFLDLEINNESVYFTWSRVPINNETVSMICVNKAYAYWLLNEELPMPKTRAYLDPDATEDCYKDSAEFKKQKYIVEDILKNFKFPLIVKMNAGHQGRHVYKCKTKWDVKRAVKSIFKKKQKDYDSSVLAQQFLQIENEYRAILLDGELILLYEKVSGEKNRNLSPLHTDEGKAVIIDDENIKKTISDIVDRSPKLKSFGWIGLDVAKDKDGNWWILELNTRPGFVYFIRDNGDERIVEVYEKLLKRIRDGKK